MKRAKEKHAGGRPPAEEPSETISVRLPVSQADALYQLAIRQRTTVSALLRPCLQRLLADVGAGVSVNRNPAA